MSIQRCYLVGGAPLSGKSTQAVELLSRYPDALYLPTDDVYEWMVSSGRADAYPALAAATGIEPEQFYTEHTNPQEIVDHEIRRGHAISQELVGLLRHAQLLGGVVVVEGYPITPGAAKDLQQRFAEVNFTVTFLYESDAERISRRIASRGLYSRPPESYPDWIKPREAEWVRLYNEYYRSEASRYGFAVMTNANSTERSPADLLALPEQKHREWRQRLGLNL